MPQAEHKTKSAVFHYNPDLSGKVRIVAKAQQTPQELDVNVQVTISLDDMVDFLEQCVVIPTIVDQVKRSTLYELIRMR